MGSDIAVVVSTRNRPAGIAGTIGAILANDHPSFEVVLVDQSDDDSTREAVREYLGRPNFIYRFSTNRGLAAGRNEGIESSQSPIIAMTDDDCEVTPDWLRRIADAFPADPRIGIVFGNVLAGPHDRTQGFIPAYQRREPFLAKSIRDKHRIEGIGASMAIRRTAWEALNGFDENFGAGGRFGSAEELEFTVRALVSGFAVYAEPAAAVVHHGFRTWESGRELISGYLYGIGAMFAKLLKLGHWSILYLMFQLASRWAFQGPVVDLGRKPPRLLRLSAFVRGFLAGLAFPIDRRRGHYARAKSAPAAKVVAQN